MVGPLVNTYLPIHPASLPFEMYLLISHTSKLNHRYSKQGDETLQRTTLVTYYGAISAIPINTTIKSKNYMYYIIYVMDCPVTQLSKYTYGTKQSLYLERHI